MCRDFRELDRLGIVVWDVRADNYRPGRLVDFSQALMATHRELDWNSTFYPRSTVMKFCIQDQVSFDTMIYQWNDDHLDRHFSTSF